MTRSPLTSLLFLVFSPRQPLCQVPEPVFFCRVKPGLKIKRIMLWSLDASSLRAGICWEPLGRRVQLGCSHSTRT